MACFACGLQFATISAHGMFRDGERREYCESCFFREFGQQPEVAKLARQVVEMREGDFQKQLQERMEQMKTVLGLKLDELVAREPHFPREAYEFLYAALFRATQRNAPGDRSRGNHATAMELVRACEAHAQAAWGDRAKSRMASLGLRTSSDIGDLVFLLVENRLLGKRPEDDRSDFDHIPFFNDNSNI